MKEIKAKNLYEEIENYSSELNDNKRREELETKIKDLYQKVKDINCELEKLEAEYVSLFGGISIKSKYSSDGTYEIVVEPSRDYLSSFLYF